VTLGNQFLGCRTHDLLVPNPATQPTRPPQRRLSRRKTYARAGARNECDFILKRPSRLNLLMLRSRRMPPFIMRMIAAVCSRNESGIKGSSHSIHPTLLQ
jgi:hypothetical protein